MRITVRGGAAVVTGFVLVMGIGIRAQRPKGLDTFSPCGPYLTLKEDVPDPHNLAIEARLNGQKWDLPNANTRHLTFKIPQLIAFLSQRMTLLPGDIVQTGVPAPVVPLRAGDVVEITIERLGTLRNRVVARATPSSW